MSIHFNSQNFKLFSLVSSNSTIQFSISLVFVQTQLNVKTVLFQTIQFSVNSVSMSKTVPISNNSVWHKYTV